MCRWLSSPGDPKVSIIYLESWRFCITLLSGVTILAAFRGTSGLPLSIRVGMSEYASTHKR